jgi:hypothetical protein
MPYQDTDQRRRTYAAEQAECMADLAGWLRRQAKATAPLPLLSWSVWPGGALVGKVNLAAVSSELTVRQVLDLYAAALRAEVATEDFGTLRICGHIGPHRRTLVQISTVNEEEASQHGHAEPDAPQHMD